jgi:acyl dehydratase
MTTYPSHIELQCGPVTAVDLALFAAASGDHNPLHLDTDVARAAGFERPVVHGMFTMAYVARMFTQHFGDGCVLSLETRFIGAALRGDRLEFSATLARMDDGVARYDLRAHTEGGTELVSGYAVIEARPA